MIKSYISHPRLSHQTYYDCLEYHFCPVNETTAKVSQEKCPAGREFYCNKEVNGNCQTSLEDSCRPCDPGFFRNENMALEASSPCLVRIYARSSLFPNSDLLLHVMVCCCNGESESLVYFVKIILGLQMHYSIVSLFSCIILSLLFPSPTAM